MKTIKALVPAVLAALLFTGCATTQTSSGVRHFHESKAANVVLQFSSWDYTFLVRPRYDDNGFLLQVPREQIGQVLNQMGVRDRQLAVVVVGWNYAPDKLRELVADWKTILGGCGFQRVVLLKSAGKQLNGALVIDDSIISKGPAGVTQRQTQSDNAEKALLASAARADDPHSSGDPIR
ncbi:MAG: hypothetical protein U1F65_10395 [Verrucomicrobiota bacterium]